MASTRTAARILLALAVGGSLARGAVAQPVEVLGVRALGLGGAFVAVADDPSAGYWNPAGLAEAGFFGLVVDLHQFDRPRADARWPGSGAVGYRSYLVAAATPPLGLAYYRISQAGELASQVGKVSDPGRQPIARLVTDQVAVTLAQSLLAGVTVGASLKFVHGSAGAGAAESATSASDVRDQAWRLDGLGSNAFDVDVGVRATLGRLALGLTARNLAAPRFATADGTELGLDRQVRLGAALRPAVGWIVAADADLLTAQGLDGPSRHAAFGAEYWVPSRRFGLRGGLKVSTLGAAAPVVSAGASVALRDRVWLEAHGSGGDAVAERGGGIGLRFAY